MESLLLALNGWLDGIGLVDWARGSAVVYPIANVLHILGLVMLVGAIAVVDLRIAGLWRRLPLEPLSHALTPIAIAGLLVQGASGLVLFAADGEALATSTTFQLKLILLALAVLNALSFRFRWRRKRPGALAQPSPIERASALFSLFVWVCIAILGRLIAYY
ncbi:hypothetical protein [Pelagerythrobacter sp.]|uniref:hypothetical protein n=1 Tax=Pelagerythrobacter sp. TaxID=2800702 RepID=UPI0035AE482C